MQFNVLASRHTVFPTLDERSIPFPVLWNVLFTLLCWLWQQASWVVRDGCHGIGRACQLASSAFLASASGSSDLVIAINPPRFTLWTCYQDWRTVNYVHIFPSMNWWFNQSTWGFTCSGWTISLCLEKCERSWQFVNPDSQFSVCGET